MKLVLALHLKGQQWVGSYTCDDCFHEIANAINAARLHGRSSLIGDPQDMGTSYDTALAAIKAAETYNGEFSITESGAGVEGCRVIRLEIVHCPQSSSAPTAAAPQ